MPVKIRPNSLLGKNPKMWHNSVRTGLRFGGIDPYSQAERIQAIVGLRIAPRVFATSLPDANRSGLKTSAWQR
jgi:hypothetical protein